VQRFHIVTENEDPYAASPEDLERLSRVVTRLQTLLNDPVALIDRARALLLGTAEKIEGLV
jgi:hypothetical protein